MLIEFKAIQGQSITDVVLNTYGTINLLGKLVEDNGIQSLNGVTETGDVFVYDSELITDESLYNFVMQNKTKFRTGILGQLYLATENNIILQSETAQNFTP